MKSGIPSETPLDKIKPQDARIVQASVMDESSILLNFSDGSSALVPSEEVRKLVASSGAKVIHDREVVD